MTRLLQLLIHRSARFRALMHKELLTTLKDVDPLRHFVWVRRHIQS